MNESNFLPCIVIPCYRHVEPLIKNIEKILSFGFKIYVVDDGNDQDSRNLLQINLKKYDLVTIISLPNNLGKGGAMEKGFLVAYNDGFTHVLQIDADGQQNMDKISEFMEVSKQNPLMLISGTPIYSNVPKIRLISRYITHFWVSVELGLFQFVDTMCGMRVYPLKSTIKLLNNSHIGRRMDFDTEIFVKLYWSGVDFKTLPVEVFYHQDGVSNFAPFKDNIRISVMHTRLCVEKVFYYWKIHKREYL
ncbi:MAG: glycosyltransferase family 2 protein [Succinivibrionaceae bacterium]